MIVRKKRVCVMFGSKLFGSIIVPEKNGKGKCLFLLASQFGFFIYVLFHVSVQLLGRFFVMVEVVLLFC